MNCNTMMSAIANTKDAPKFLQVSFARGRSLYLEYKLTQAGYVETGKRSWNSGFSHELVTEAYSRCVLKGVPSYNRMRRFTNILNSQGRDCKISVTKSGDLNTAGIGIRIGSYYANQENISAGSIRRMLFDAGITT